MKTVDLFKSDPRLLAPLLSLDRVHRHWDAAELGMILGHQLRTPLADELARLEPSARNALAALSGPNGINTFADLLRHSAPPLGALVLTKDFSKACTSDPESPLPREIATVLYYASIASALLRLGRRISGLNDQGLRQGFDWVARQPWVDADLRDLCEHASQRVG